MASNIPAHLNCLQISYDSKTSGFWILLGLMQRIYSGVELFNCTTRSAYWDVNDLLTDSTDLAVSFSNFSLKILFSRELVD